VDPVVVTFLNKKLCCRREAARLFVAVVVLTVASNSSSALLVFLRFNNSVPFSSVWPSTDINDVDACWYQHSSTI